MPWAFAAPKRIYSPPITIEQKLAITLIVRRLARTIFGDTELFGEAW
jgi:hypothetical protein